MSAWDRVARLYDLQLPLERAALRLAVEMAEVEPEDRALDLGCGTGGVLSELAGRRAAPRAAVGVDPSARMLARVPPLPAGWRLVRAEASALPFGDRSFDLVTAAYLLHLLDAGGRAGALREARRVLRPGGRLVAVTVAPPRSERLARAIDRGFRAVRAGGPLAGLRPLDPTAELRAAGFAVHGRRRTARGYPSLIVAARLSEPEPPAGPPGPPSRS